MDNFERGRLINGHLCEDGRVSWTGKASDCWRPECRARAKKAVKGSFEVVRVDRQRGVVTIERSKP